MKSSSGYMEAVQRICCIAGGVYFFLTKVVQPRDQHNADMVM